MQSPPSPIAATAHRSDQPTPASSLQVKIPAQGLTLEGTLELPAGKGPFPGVVLVHGSGPQSRDEITPGQLAMKFASPVAVFQDLAQQLAKQGIAVLRYDKRSCYKKNGCNNAYPEPSTQIVIEDFLGDAKSALRYLASLPNIDANKLVVVGHSQGAGLVPMILEQMPQLFAGVAMAPPGSSFAKTLQTQVDKSLTMVPQAQKALAQAQMKPLIEQIQKVQAFEQGGDLKEPVLGAPPAFIKSQVNAAKEALEVARRIDRPIIAIRGDYDWNISPQDFAEWKDALKSSSHASKHQIIELSGLTHALNRIAQPDPSKIEPQDIGAKVHPSVAKAIATAIR